MSTPLADAVAKIGGTGLDVTATDTAATTATVTATGAVSVWKGWSVGGTVQWARDRFGWAVGASWRPKK